MTCLPWVQQTVCTMRYSKTVGALSVISNTAFYPFLILNAWSRLVDVSFNMLTGFPGGSVVKNLSEMQRCRLDSWAGKIPLEEEMATHSNNLAQKTPWAEDPSGLHSMGLIRVGHG